MRSDNLRCVHNILSRGPYANRMEVQPGYAAVLKLATAKPDTDDRPAKSSTTRAARARA